VSGLHRNLHRNSVSCSSNRLTPSVLHWLTSLSLQGVSPPGAMQRKLLTTGAVVAYQAQSEPPVTGSIPCRGSVRGCNEMFRVGRIVVHLSSDGMVLLTAGRSARLCLEVGSRRGACPLGRRAADGQGRLVR
jgi:hypothetical protein